MKLAATTTATNGCHLSLPAIPGIIQGWGWSGCGSSAADVDSSHQQGGRVVQGFDLERVREPWMKWQREGREEEGKEDR